jgi:hypothetical protein
LTRQKQEPLSPLQGIRPALGPTQLNILYILGAPSLRALQQKHLSTHCHLMPRIKMSGAIPPLPHMPSWCAWGQPDLYRAVVSVHTVHLLVPDTAQCCRRTPSSMSSCHQCTKALSHNSKILFPLIQTWIFLPSPSHSSH